MYPSVHLNWESEHWPNKTHIYWSLKQELFLKTWGLQTPEYLSISNCSSPSSALHKTRDSLIIFWRWAWLLQLWCSALQLNVFQQPHGGERKKHSFQFCNDLLTALNNWGGGGGLGGEGRSNYSLMQADTYLCFRLRSKQYQIWLHILHKILVRKGKLMTGRN